MQRKKEEPPPGRKQARDRRLRAGRPTPTRQRQRPSLLHPPLHHDLRDLVVEEALLPVKLDQDHDFRALSNRLDSAQFVAECVRP